MLAPLLFPQRCVHCRKQFGSYVCDECFAKISFCTKQYCPAVSCGKPSLHGLVHTRCEKSSALDGHIAIAQYDGVIKSMLEFYKRRGVYKLEPILVRAMERYLIDEIEEPIWEAHAMQPPMVTCVPMYWIEQRFKGYNTAQRVADIVAGIFSYKTDYSLIRKAGPTLPQKDLTRHERLKNLKGAFAFTSSEQSPRFVLLIDDVWTTGATLQECAKVLKQTGAETVWGITLARGV